MIEVPGIAGRRIGQIEILAAIAGAELPCLIVNVMRGGPGLGTIQPSQADYFQTVKDGGHGDYRLIALAPASVQEMADFVGIAFDLAFKYRNPANPDQGWSGRGRKPQWALDWIAQGKPLDELAV